MHRHYFEVLDKALRDIIGYKDESKSELPFGGKTIVLEGDFRKILPVIPKRESTRYCKCNSQLFIFMAPLWIINTDKEYENAKQWYCFWSKRVERIYDWILTVADGSIGNSFDEIDKVLTAKDLLITEFTDPTAAIVESYVSRFSTNGNNVGYHSKESFLLWLLIW